MNQLFLMLLSLMVLTGCAPQYTGTWTGDAAERESCSFFGKAPVTTEVLTPTKWYVTEADSGLTILGPICGGLTATLQADGFYAIKDVNCDTSESSFFVRKLTITQGLLGLADDGLLRFTYRRTTTAQSGGTLPLDSSCLADVSAALKKE